MGYGDAAARANSLGEYRLCAGLRVNRFWLISSPGFLKTDADLMITSNPANMVSAALTVSSQGTKTSTAARSVQQTKHRAYLLAKMKTTWIQEVLEPSLQGRPLIDLGMEYSPNVFAQRQDLSSDARSPTRRVGTILSVEVAY